jgi:hypothetical protein
MGVVVAYQARDVEGDLGFAEGVDDGLAQADEGVLLLPPPRQQLRQNFLALGVSAGHCSTQRTIRHCANPLVRSSNVVDS